MKKGWEISIIELTNSFVKKYKITRRNPKMKIAETKILRSKEKAKEKFEEWLQ